MCCDKVQNAGNDKPPGNVKPANKPPVQGGNTYSLALISTPGATERKEILPTILNGNNRPKMFWPIAIIIVLILYIWSD